MKPIPLVFGHEHDCEYLPGQTARMMYVSPHEALDREIYGCLVRNGFRRSGDLVYRPNCRRCAACLPARIPVQGFRPDRTQRRTWIRNADLCVVRGPAVFDEEQYRLYLRYQQTRHADGQMGSSSPGDYIGFLGSRWAETEFCEFREQDRLCAVAVVDLLEDGLSAVYTFYDPDSGERSLGTQAVLWLVEEARRRGLPWVYLGYWISGCRKMAYKNKFRPLQVLRRKGWEWAAEGEGA